MKLAIFGRLTDHTDFRVVLNFFRFLQANGIDYAVDPSYAKALTDRSEEWAVLLAGHLFTKKGLEQLQTFDYAYSFGGDGTFLNTASYVRGTLPVLGVNFGRLGFLTTISQENLIEATQHIMKGSFTIEERSGLILESNSAGLFGKQNFALNDLTIHKSQTNEMITVHTYINGEFLNSYWGDGLIIATPTGSTAYSLSCGGPIIHPKSPAFVITPVAPHSLTVRPMIVPDSYVISFEIESRSGQAMLALDTRSQLVDKTLEIAIRKSETPVRLIKVPGVNYLNTLRGKLMWGKDTRN